MVGRSTFRRGGGGGGTTTTTPDPLAGTRRRPTNSYQQQPQHQQQQQPPPPPGRLSLRQLVHWDDGNHLQVLTQINGSVWPKVWKFCLVNGLLMTIVYHWRQRAAAVAAAAGGGDGGASTTTVQRKPPLGPTTTALGHQYMALVMSFLVVTRVVQSYDRYNADSAALHELYRSTREVITASCDLFLDYPNTTTSSSSSSLSWRQQVATQMLQLLAISMQVLHFRSRIYADRLTTVPEQLRCDHHSWSSASTAGGGGGGRHDDDDDDDDPITIRAAVPGSGVRRRRRGLESSSPLPPQRPVGPTVLLAEACRAVTHQAYNVRRTILSYRDNNTEGTPVPNELVMLDPVGIFMQQFAILEQHMTTGLEIVAMELTDCFGDDDCDLDIDGGAAQCYEDCYLALYKNDGRDAALQLKQVVDGFHHNHRTPRMGKAVPMEAALAAVRMLEENFSVMAVAVMRTKDDERAYLFLTDLET